MDSLGGFSEVQLFSGTGWKASFRAKESAVKNFIFWNPVKEIETMRPFCGWDDVTDSLGWHRPLCLRPFTRT